MKRIGIARSVSGEEWELRWDGFTVAMVDVGGRIQSEPIEAHTFAEAVDVALDVWGSYATDGGWCLSEGWSE